VSPPVYPHVKPNRKDGSGRVGGKTDWKAFFKKTIVIVFLFSVAVHVLLLIGFGGVTLFKGRDGRVPFSVESLPSETAETPPAPPEDEMVQEEKSVDSSMMDKAPAVEESAPPLEMMTVPGGVSWAPAIPKDMKTSLTGSVGRTSAEGQASSSRSSGLGRKSSFFGINIDQKTPRIILLLDTSDTMFKRKRGADTYTYDYGVIKKEACDLIKNLEETAQFNVVLYEGGAVAFQKNMVVLSDSLKSEVIKWISDIDENPIKSIKERQGNDTLFEGGGTRLDTGLALAFRYDPTTIFLLTDGDANIRHEKESKKLKEEDIIPLIKQLQSKQKKSATIHVIYYQTKEAKESETELVKAIAAQGRGTFKVVKAQMVSTDKVKKDVEEKKK
jgi:hypothetical protein